MSFTTTQTIRMIHETCWVCGIAFAMPKGWSDRRKENGKNFHCPAGCSLRYGESPSATGSPAHVKSSGCFVSSWPDLALYGRSSRTTKTVTSSLAS